MNMASVMDALGDALATIDGLRAVPYSAQTISPPAAWVEWPETYTYDTTMGRGSDSMTIEVRVAVGGVDSRASRDLMGEYVSGSGDKSVKAAIERHTTTAYDSARVASVDFGVTPVAGTDYLTASFSVDIMGSGA